MTAVEGGGRDLVMDGTVQRGDFTLQARVSVRAGDVLGVIGPNGAGKTTLLRALAGLEQLTSGSIALAGEVLDEPEQKLFVPAQGRPIGVVFQNYRLFPAMNVRDNVAFGPRCRGAGRSRANETADDWLGRLGLAELAGRRPHQLSGGQAQRVALARALAAEPRLLLLDEPLAALDAGTKLDVRAELRHHLARFRGATVLVTHDPLEAMIMTNQLLVLEAGRVVQVGKPAEVARRPTTDYVARLVGLNFYTGRLGSSGKVVLDGGSTLVAATAEPPGRVLVALRPNAISLHSVRPEHASPRNVWRGTVTALELLTDRVRVQVDGSPPAMVDLTPDAVADLHVVEGSPVWLSAKATDVDVYPDGN